MSALVACVTRCDHFIELDSKHLAGPACMLVDIQVNILLATVVSHRMNES